MKPRPKLVALVGGSGAGKTWLAQRLRQTLPFAATILSLDDFYRDQSHLVPALRARLNFDHPRAIDWRLAEAVLRGCRAGHAVRCPSYSFQSHTRQPNCKLLTAAPVILMDGLWLLRRPQLRRLFDISVFLHCPARLRLARRLERDMASRGRDARSVRRQFRETVNPMHKKFVAPQAKWADFVFRQPPGRKQIKRLAAVIAEMVPHAEALASGIPRSSRRQ